MTSEQIQERIEKIKKRYLKWLFVRERYYDFIAFEMSPSELEDLFSYLDTLEREMEIVKKALTDKKAQA